LFVSDGGRGDCNVFGGGRRDDDRIEMRETENDEEEMPFFVFNKFFFIALVQKTDRTYNFFFVCLFVYI
jgi:hypothetical protein